MRWLLVSVALVAFSLTAPAQAETWSCVYCFAGDLHDSDKRPLVMVLKRKSDWFVDGEDTWKIVDEIDQRIHLDLMMAADWSGAVTIVLWKKKSKV
jgi:hypothetical protein